MHHFYWKNTQDIAVPIDDVFKTEADDSKFFDTPEPEDVKVVDATNPEDVKVVDAPELKECQG